MRTVDYIVVGLGIAGIAICEVLLRNGHSFVVVDNGEKGATANSGGVFNPTVLKRFSAAWNTSSFYPAAIQFYRDLSNKLNVDFFQEMPILRVFKSVEEQNDWSVASDKNDLKPFLSSYILHNKNQNIKAPLGYGRVEGTARIKTADLLQSYRNYLDKDEKLLVQEFDYASLLLVGDNVIYQGITAKKVIFCEGPRVRENPFFPKDAIIPNMGVYVIIRSEELDLEALLKGPFYIIPLENSQYKVGATFGAGIEDALAIDRAKIEILSKLKTMINCSYQMIGDTAGIRPTTRDRKPLVGTFPTNPRMAFLNGLGSRGFTMAPLLAQILYGHLEESRLIPQEMDINRIK